MHCIGWFMSWLVWFQGTGFCEISMCNCEQLYWLVGWLIIGLVGYKVTKFWEIGVNVLIG